MTELTHGTLPPRSAGASIARGQVGVHPHVAVMINVVALLAVAMPCSKVSEARTQLVLKKAYATPELLWSMAPSLPVEAVAEAFRGSDQGRSRFVFGMGLAFTHSSRALPILKSLTATTGFARGARALGLLALGQPSETSTVAELFEQGSPSVRRHLASALGRMNENRPRTMSYDLLRDEDPEVLLSVALVHLRRGSRRAKDAVERLLEQGTKAEASPQERKAAQRAARLLLSTGHTLPSQCVHELPGPIQSAAVWARYSKRQLERWAKSGVVPLQYAASAALLTKQSVTSVVSLFASSPAVDVFPEKRAAIMLQLLSGPVLKRWLRRRKLDPRAFQTQVIGHFKAWKGSLSPEFETRFLRAFVRLNRKAALPLARDLLRRELLKADSQHPGLTLEALNVLRVAGQLADRVIIEEALEKATDRTRLSSLNALQALCDRDPGSLLR